MIVEGRIRLASYCIAAGLFLAPDVVAAQRVIERYGNIEYTDPRGTTRRLTEGGGFGEPALSPDGHTVAYLQRRNNASRALWIANGLSSLRRVISVARIASNGEEGAEYSRPTFSLDGGFVYVTESAAAPGSVSVQQINLASGRRRRVIDGHLVSVIRTGPYRGYLLVQRHMYYDQGGSYNPVYVVRPDARETFVVPGSENDDGETAVQPWLRRRGWTAW